jgi:hypothetical protein
MSTDRQNNVDSLFQESQAWLDQYQALKRADLARLHSDLGNLEARRSELTERVSQDNADRAAQSDLSRVEASIEEIKDQIGAMREEVRRTVMAKRREVNDILNREVTALQDEVTRSRAEKEKIRTELLPALDMERERLIERTKGLEADVLQLTEKISHLNRFNIESEDLEFD